MSANWGLRVDTRLGLGRALRDMGRFAEPNEQFERALDIDSGNGEALLGLRGKTEPGDPCFARLHRALSQSYIFGNERANLHSAAGKTSFRMLIINFVVSHSLRS